MIRRLSTAQPDFDTRLAELLAFETAQDPKVDEVVASILADIKARGDTALLEHTRRLDAVHVDAAAQLEIPLRECQEALARLPDSQRAESWSIDDDEGNQLGQKVTPLDRVGVYVPGGKAAYPSSVIMNVTPAKVAGVPEVIMAVPTPAGERNPLVLAAAALSGVDRVFTIGGAQAVGALAYGTQLVPAVDKIVGPGNAYVAAAKRRVFGIVGIDMVAGPSEILVVADGTNNPDWIAMDLFSQAEHDELAQAILLSTDREFIEAVARSIERQLPGMPRRDVIADALSGRGALIEARDLDEVCELVNRIAPEHLELAVAQAETLLPKVRHAGAIFIGHYASEALGDYCAGPNHVLPTSRTARFSSPLGVYDFQKRSSVIRISRAGAAKLGLIAAELARGEGLEAHARSAELRIQ